MLNEKHLDQTLQNQTVFELIGYSMVIKKNKNLFGLCLKIHFQNFDYVNVKEPWCVGFVKCRMFMQITETFDSASWNVKTLMLYISKQLFTHMKSYNIEATLHLYLTIIT